MADERKLILETKDMSIHFGGLIAVNSFSLKVYEHEIVAIIGPNGAGKTTAFNMITGVYTPTEGEIFLDGQKINGIRPDILTSHGMARTFQNIRLFKNLTVLDNVLIGHHVHKEAGFFSTVLQLPKAAKEEEEMRKHSLELLEFVGLLEYKDEIASNLPYGLQRRLEIARALATRPKLLLLDEPAAGMNPTETEALTEFIHEIREKLNMTILLIEHHMQLVMDISDRIYVLEYGKEIAHGVPKEIQSNPKVIKAYLGEEDDE